MFDNTLQFFIHLICVDSWL